MELRLQKIPTGDLFRPVYKMKNAHYTVTNMDVISEIIDTILSNSKSYRVIHIQAPMNMVGKINKAFSEEKTKEGGKLFFSYFINGIQREDGNQPTSYWQSVSDLGSGWETTYPVSAIS